MLNVKNKNLAQILTNKVLDSLNIEYEELKLKEIKYTLNSNQREEFSDLAHSYFTREFLVKLLPEVNKHNYVELNINDVTLYDILFCFNDDNSMDHLTYKGVSRLLTKTVPNKKGYRKDKLGVNSFEFDLTFQ